MPTTTHWRVYRRINVPLLSSKCLMHYMSPCMLCVKCSSVCDIFRLTILSVKVGTSVSGRSHWTIYISILRDQFLWSGLLCGSNSVTGDSGFLAKMLVFLVNSWFPETLEKALVSGSMILAGVLLKLLGYGLLCASFLVLVKFVCNLNFNESKHSVSFSSVQVEFRSSQSF